MLVGGNLLVSDMTSSLGTKEIDINKFGVVFASA
jgi:phosphoserine aminotransferase